MEINHLCANIHNSTVQKDMAKWVEALAKGRLHKNAASIFTKFVLRLGSRVQ